jgi:hypothetical protein
VGVRQRPSGVWWPPTIATDKAGYVSGGGVKMLTRCMCSSTWPFVSIRYAAYILWNRRYPPLFFTGVSTKSVTPCAGTAGSV